MSSYNVYGTNDGKLFVTSDKKGKPTICGFDVDGNRNNVTLDKVSKNVYINEDNKTFYRHQPDWRCMSMYAFDKVFYHDGTKEMNIITCISGDKYFTKIL